MTSEPPVRQELSDDELSEMIGTVWKNRIDQYSVDRTLSKASGKKKVEMSYIGG
nr:molybdenum cofactor biosynthesis enzyme [Bacillus subtilis]